MSLTSDVRDITEALEQPGALFLLSGHRSLTPTGRSLASAVWRRFELLTRSLARAEHEVDRLKSEVEGLRYQNHCLTQSLQLAEGKEARMRRLLRPFGSRTP